MEWLSTGIARGKSRATVLFFAWLCSVAIDVTVSLGLGSGFAMLAPAGYYALYAVLGLVTSVVLGFMLGLLGLGVELSIALWVFFNSLHGANLFASIGAGAGIWIVLILTRRFQVPPWVKGARAGAACGVALAMWPVATIQVPRSIRFDATLAALIPLLLFLTVYLTLAAVGGPSRNRLRRMAESGFLLLIVLLAFFTGSQWEQTNPGHLPVDRERPNTSAAPNILLVVLDTLRADRMSIYGHDKLTTPRLDAFLTRHDNAIVYPLAFSNANWTIPSHASLFTGLLPTAHGANIASESAKGTGMFLTTRLKPGPTLAQKLRLAGYRTGGIIANYTLRSNADLNRGFDLWYFGPRTQKLHLLGESIRRITFPDSFAWVFSWYPSANTINTGVTAFLEACGAGPCFVFVNYMEPHAPYVPRPPHAGMFTEGRTEKPADYLPWIKDGVATLTHFKGRYDESIHELDEALGNLLENLEARGFLDDAWLVITSDHGESFGEHGVTGHGTSLYNEQVRIPLIIKPPRGQHLPQIYEPVSLIDVTTTLTEAVTRKSLGNGVSLLKSEAPRKPVQMQYFGTDEPERGAVEGVLRATAAGTRKLIDNGHTQQIYDLTTDLDEQNDLFIRMSSVERNHLFRLLPEMPNKIRHEDTGVIAPGQQDDGLTEEDREGLRALGYLD